MPIRPHAVSREGSRPGEINYRLARLALVTEYRAGHLSVNDVCDAHPELIRAAQQVGEPTTDLCPICEDANLVIVRYVFGPRLPAHGRCVTTAAEMERLRQRKGEFTVYAVEACPSCAFNHLRRSYPLKR